MNHGPLFHILRGLLIGAVIVGMLAFPGFALVVVFLILCVLISVVLDPPGGDCPCDY